MAKETEKTQVLSVASPPKLDGGDSELITVHCEGRGTRLLEKKLWPTLKLGDEVETVERRQNKGEQIEEFPSQESMEWGEMEEETGGRKIGRMLQW